MFNSLTFKYKVPYKLRPFSHCRLLNDSVRAASLMIRKVNYESTQNIDLEPNNFRVLPDEVVHEKIENRNCFSCFLAIRKWKYWLMKPEHYFTKKIPCYQPYLNKFNSKIYFMTEKEIESTKLDLVFHLTNLVTELYQMQYMKKEFNTYDVQRAEYLIQQQYETKQKLKSLLGEENYEKLMSKDEMLHFIKQINNETKREV